MMLNNPVAYKKFIQSPISRTLPTLTLQGEYNIYQVPLLQGISQNSNTRPSISGKFRCGPERPTIVLVFHPSNTKLTEDIYGVLSTLMISLADAHHSPKFTIQDYFDDLDNYIKRYELRLQSIKLLRKFLSAFQHHLMIGIITSFMELNDEDLDDLKESAEEYDKRHEPKRIRTVASDFEQFNRAIEQRRKSVRQFAVRGRIAAGETARTQTPEERSADEEAKRIFKETIARLKTRADSKDS